MSATSKPFRTKTSPATRRFTSSRGSAASRWACAAPASPKTCASSPEDSPARTSATPENAPELPDPVRDSGGRWCVAFAWYDRGSSSWRTWQRCFVEGWAKYSETWPRSVMTRKGIAFQPQTLAPLTCDDESGLWPTPSAVEYGSNQSPSDGASVRPSLNTMAKWPTPEAADGTRGSLTHMRGNPTLLGAALWPTIRSNESGSYQYSKGNHDKPTLTLTGAAKLWPTPRSEDSQCAGSHRNKNGATWDSLHSAVKLWPTPTAHDAMGGRGSNNLFADGHHYPHDLADAVNWRTPQSRDYKGKTSEKRATREMGDNTPSLADQVGGQLNPTWVEWLMGYPAEWTVLLRSATPSSRSASKK